MIAHIFAIDIKLLRIFELCRVIARPGQ